MKLGAFSSRRHGFTLVELMVTLAIAAILATVAAPMLSRFLAKSQMNAVANEFMGAIQLARTEAVNRNTCVTICRRPSTGAATCAGSDGPWTAGWIVYPDPACTGAPEATDPPAGSAIRVQERVPEAITLTKPDGGALNGHLRITPRGVVSGTFMTIRLNDSRFTDRSNAVDITISMQGRVRRESVEPQ